MRGRIVKGIAGFYYVYVDGKGVYECKAKGIFRKDNLKPLVGDMVDMSILSEDGMEGNIDAIEERENSLIRPLVANVDQALIIFSLTKPEPNFVMLDKMILQYEYQNVPVIICFNKEDLVPDDFCESVINDYKNSGCAVYVTSAKAKMGIDELKNALSGKMTTVAGPSGVGKSSIINCLLNESVSKIGDISRKLERGKHTTRHSEIFPISGNTFIMDTPGFGSFDLFDIGQDELKDYYEEFELGKACRFMPCSHTHEPDCSVKEAVSSGHISKRRYENYVQIYEELSKVRRY